MPPLTFMPILKRIRWGGRRLGTVLGKPLGPEADYAESWEIADHGQDQSIVREGPFAGWTLQRLVQEHRTELLGRHASLEQFPLLVKFLDVSDHLSVQVHPNDDQAQRLDGSANGKTEAWIIIAADEHSRVYAGLRPGVTAAQLRSAIAAGTIEQCLHSFAVRPGDVVFVPAGTVHALGRGLILAEIQQSSDLTYRLYDWNRLGADGQPRPLHIEQALKCIDFSAGPQSAVFPELLAQQPGYRRERLVTCDHFAVERHTSRVSVPLECDNRCHVLMVLAGAVTLVSDDAPVRLAFGQCGLLPAGRSATMLKPDGECVVLDACLP